GASGSLDATLPLDAQVGGFDLATYGHANVIVHADPLFALQNGQLALTTPEVLLDLGLTDVLRQKVLDLLTQLDGVGQNALGPSLPVTALPVINKSIQDLLGGQQSVGGVLHLKDAAASYFNLELGSGRLPTLRGLLDVLRQQLSATTSEAFDPD